MIRTIIPAVLVLLGTPALAQDTAPMSHDDHGHHDHNHQAADSHSAHGDSDGHQHEKEASNVDGAADSGQIFTTPEITGAIEAGGEPVVVDVLGVVCDFCARAMNKTFGKRDEVAAVYVDLDTKTLNLVLKPEATLSDETISELVTKAGYKTAAIRRGDAVLNAEAAAEGAPMEGDDLATDPS